MHLRRTLSLAAVLLSAVTLFAQEPAQEMPPLPTLKLSTSIVVLDVVVTDKKGNLVLDKTRDDFTIVEDRVPQKMRSFEPPSAHVMPPNVVVNGVDDLKKIGDAPVNILVLDELNTRFEDMAYVRYSMLKYLNAQPAVLKLPTVLLLATNTRFKQLHDYTQDRDALIAQVKNEKPELPTKMMAGRGGSAAVERMAQGLASLEQIAQASGGTPGRKNVIWVGNGFPSADLVGLDDKTAATIEAAIKQVTDMLLAARITMYTINPTMNSTVTLDVETPDDLTMAETDTGGEPFSGSVQFSTFGPATGGRAFLSRNDINNEIAEGISQGANYYTMSYAPVNGSADAAKYRNIRIVMKDPNLHATTRDGYYPPTASTANPTVGEAPKQAKAQLQMEISNAVNSAISYNGLGVTAVKAGADYTLTVKGAGLEWKMVDEKTERTEATVIAAWYGGKDGMKLLGHAGKELLATRPVGSAGDATLTMPLVVPPGATRLRFVVRDAVNGRMGTADILKP
ncbi:VWFA-related domain-containing protein [Granulicella rosea]|uniref:VWFA-related domain-containing protein n=1 Tax=Granulicella rosea TaxID=474952 RepID=A0A239CN48_9BACT|nr:VWA domain-containing protein [Granulicella rosea]SNS21686.1 VWFA-related domain-containing protein [Granulicella rosea]